MFETRALQTPPELHAIAPTAYLDGNRCKANPSLSASKNLNRTLGLGSFSLFFSAFIIAYNVVKPPISACSRLY